MNGELVPVLFGISGMAVVAVVIVGVHDALVKPNEVLAVKVSKALSFVCLALAAWAFLLWAATFAVESPINDTERWFVWGRPWYAGLAVFGVVATLVFRSRANRQK